MIVKFGEDTVHKTIIVVGVQRGGTSMVAGVIRELGVNLGKNLGNNHEDPQFITKDLDRILELVRLRNEEHDVWGWKMPHTSEYLTKILSKIRNPFVIVVFRNLLGMVESQLKRSQAEMEDAYKFSYNRLVQVGSIVPELKCPLMLVNYEKAAEKPDSFVDEMIEFLHLAVDARMRERAIQMINPAIGYRRASRESWKYSVSKYDPRHEKKKDKNLKKHRENVNIVAKKGRLQKLDDKASFIEYSDIDGTKFDLFVTLEGKEEKIRVVVNVGSGYSRRNMGENISLFQGRNVVSISADSIKGIRIYPQFDGPWSNTKLFQLFSND
jgi:hypothetical protein